MSIPSKKQGMNKTHVEVLAELKTLKKAFINVLDGDSDWWDIHEKTGLPGARCKEISNLFAEISREKE